MQQQQISGIYRDSCPWEAFCNNLLDFISTWQHCEENIILCINMNKESNCNNGPLQQTLIRNNKLVNVIKYQHNIPTPATHNWCSKTINAIFISDTIVDVENAGWLWFGKGIGDHRIAFIDVPNSSLIGKNWHQIAQRQHQQLQIKNRAALKIR